MLRGRPVPGENAVEPLEHVLAEVDGDRVLRVVQLILGARPDDRPGNALLVQQPGQRHVGRLLAEFVAQRLVGRDLLVVPLPGFGGPAGLAAPALALLLQHAAEQARLERGPPAPRGGDHGMTPTPYSSAAGSTSSSISLVSRL